MSRLTKNANHVSPAMHEEVTRHTVDGNNNRSQVQQAQMEFLISKRLLACLPIVPTNERVYELAQDIQGGLFEDLGDLVNCEQNWDMWVARTADILRAKGIFVLSRLKKRTIKTASQGGPVYFDLNGKKAWCYEDPGAPVELPNGKMATCPDCGSSLSFDTIDGDSVVLECCGCGGMEWHKITKKK